MKTLKFTTILSAVIVLLLSFTSCKKDKNEPGGSGSFYEFLDTKYNISSANSKVIDGDIFLEFTSGGEGDYLQIDLPKVTTLPIGTLTYNADRFSQSYDATKNFWSTGVGLKGDNINVSGGTITIAKSGDSYTITFNLTTANGNITGTYKGTPTVTQQ